MTRPISDSNVDWWRAPIRSQEEIGLRLGLSRSVVAKTEARAMRKVAAELARVRDELQMRRNWKCPPRRLRGPGGLGKDDEHGNDTVAANESTEATCHRH